MYSKSLAWFQSLWMAERSLSIRKQELRYTRWRPNWSPLPSGLPHHLCPLSCYIDRSGFMSYHHTIEGGNMILVSIVKESNTQDCHGLSSLSNCAWLFGDFIMNHGIYLSLQRPQSWYIYTFIYIYITVQYFKQIIDQPAQPEIDWKSMSFKTHFLGVIHHFVHH